MPKPEPQGMHNLAGFLAEGRGVSIDTEAAAQWAIKAIQRNNAFTIEQMRTNGAAWGLAFRKAPQRRLREQGVYSGPRRQIRCHDASGDQDAGEQELAAAKIAARCD